MTEQILRCPECGNKHEFEADGWVEETEYVRVTRDCVFYVDNTGQIQDQEEGEVSDSEIIDSDYNEDEITSNFRCCECGAEALWVDEDETPEPKVEQEKYIEGGVEYG